MKPIAADRPHPRHAGWFLVALVAAAMLVLAGCGGTYESGLHVTYGFDGDGTSSTAGTSERLYTWNPTWGEEIKTIVIGPIFVSAGSPYDAAANITLADQEQLLDDALASLQYLELVQMSEISDTNPTISFAVPATPVDDNWQLAAVGLRNTRTQIGDVTDRDIIWMGFIAEFLNTFVVDGDLVFSGTLTLEPWCAADGNPQEPNPAPPACP